MYLVVLIIGMLIGYWTKRWKTKDENEFDDSLNSLINVYNENMTSVRKDISGIYKLLENRDTKKTED